MNTVVALDGLNYPLIAGQRYRLSGYVRGGVPDGTVLLNAGFDRGSAQFWGAVGLPADWPAEDLPPASVDEKVFRFEGVWIGTGELPSSIATPSGTFLIYNVWSYVPPLSLTSLASGSNGGTVTAVLGGAVFAVGLLGMLLLLRTPAKENPVPSLSPEQSDARIRALHRMGYKTYRVQLPSGDIVVLRKRT